MITSRSSNARTGRSHGCSRRGFVAGAVSMLGFPYLVAGRALGKGGPAAAGERITVGVIGTGNRGTDDMVGVMQSPLSQVVAVCDCRRPRLEAAKKKVERFYAEAVRPRSIPAAGPIHDFRELIDRKDIDAILVCVPDHWHGIIATGRSRPARTCTARSPWAGPSPRASRSAMPCSSTSGSSRPAPSSGATRGSARPCALARGGLLGKIHTIEVAVPAGGDMPKPAAGARARWLRLRPVDRPRADAAVRQEAVRVAGDVLDLRLLRRLHLQLGRSSPGHRRAGAAPRSSRSPFEIEGTGVPAGGRACAARS